MYCNHCGKLNTKEANFCTNCGKSIISNVDEVSNIENPFGNQYGTDINHKSFAMVDKLQRNTWTKFVFVTSMIMCIFSSLIFLGWAMTSYMIHSNIVLPDSAIGQELPSLFSVYRVAHSVGTLLSLINTSLLIAIAILSSKLKRNSLTQANTQVRQKTAKAISILTLFVLASLILTIVITSISYYSEHNIAQQLLSQNWTAEDITRTFLITLIIEPGQGSIQFNAIFSSIVLLSIQYIWLLVLNLINFFCIKKAKKS
jgi:hypothetical protein